MRIFAKIFLSVILCVLIGVGVYEEVLRTQSLKNLRGSISKIEKAIEKGEFAQDNVKVLIDEMCDDWQSTEKQLAFLINYKNIQEVESEIVKLKNYQELKDLTEFKVCLGLIKNYSTVFAFFMDKSYINNF